MHPSCHTLGFRLPAKRLLPEELLLEHAKFRERVSAREFFGNPKHQKAREQWCAAHFSRGYERHLGPCAVWLEEVDPQTDTDFKLEVDAQRHPFQVTEVQEPGRRRGDEYKRPFVSSIGGEDWSLGSEQGPEWIRAAIDKKLQLYGSVNDLNLLVYVNFPAYEVNYERVRQCVSGVAEPFASVWLLTGNAVACLKSNPRLATLEAWLGIPESP